MCVCAYVCKTIVSDSSVFWDYAASGNLKATFRDNLSVPSSKVKLSNMTLKDGPDSPETSVPTHITPRNNPEDGRIQFNRGRNLRYRNNCSLLNTHTILIKRNYMSRDVTLDALHVDSMPYKSTA